MTELHFILASVDEKLEQLISLCNNTEDTRPAQTLEVVKLCRMLVTAIDLLAHRPGSEWDGEETADCIGWSRGFQSLRELVKHGDRTKEPPPYRLRGYHVIDRETFDLEGGFTDLAAARAARAKAQINWAPSQIYIINSRGGRIE